jgi:hypothetical protein
MVGASTSLAESARLYFTIAMTSKNGWALLHVSPRVSDAISFNRLASLVDEATARS